ncbi:hypothetical protein VNO77_28427 [Canavalia gladiata]|uniref:Uncharacterized protein n=1 Tax=Canavalia gladiata TaxID=3824 RepID=A0AAN9KWR1_CANGL
MILKDLMEEKQLNFNQPLLSVRRFSSTSDTDYKRKTDNSIARFQPSPSYKSELNSGPVRNAGTIPFEWEKAPGRPKDECKLETQVVEQLPITPNFPPGRVSKVKQQDSDTVLKGTGSTVSYSKSDASLDKKVTKYERSKEGTKERESSDSDDRDEAYMDALDTLSRTESFFMSCSVSCLSGWDEPEVQVQPSGSFSSDQQGRDFMIGRFLPAAKAMTSETPHYYAFKKALVGQEQQKQIKKDESAQRLRPLIQHTPKDLPHYSLDTGNEESEDENYDCNEFENHRTTACGLFPRLRLLNTIPGLRMLDKVQSNAVNGMQAKSAASHIESAKEYGRTPNGKKLVDSQSSFTGKKVVLDILVKSKHGMDPHQRGYDKLVPCESTQRDSSYESLIVEKTLYVDSAQKVKSQTNNTKGDFETLRKDNGIHKNPSIYSSLENSKQLDAEDMKAALQPKSSESLDSPFLVCSEDSSNDLVMISSPNEVVECKKINSESQVYSSEKYPDILAQNSRVELKSQLDAKSVDHECTLANSKIGDEGKIDLETQYLMKLGHQEISDASYFRLPLSLPSLKAPSESWLKRTLPTISKRNITSRSKLIANIYSRSQTHKTRSLCPKNYKHSFQKLELYGEMAFDSTFLGKMARELLAIFHGGYGDEAVRYNSGSLFMLGMIFLSLSVISMIIFSCGHNSHKHRKKNRGISGLGGDDRDGGGDGGGGGGGGGDGYAGG